MYFTLLFYPIVIFINMPKTKHLKALKKQRRFSNMVIWGIFPKKKKNTPIDLETLASEHLGHASKDSGWNSI